MKIRFLEVQPRNTTMVKLALALGVAVTSAASCVAPSTSSQVISLDCATAGAAIAVSFTKTNVYTGLGYIALAGTSPSLCFAAAGTISSDGEPAIGLAPCDKSGGTPAQLFTQLLDGTVLSGLTGECLDLVSGVQAPNERLELFGCSGAANQVRSTTRLDARHGLRARHGLCKPATCVRRSAWETTTFPLLLRLPLLPLFRRCSTSRPRVTLWTSRGATAWGLATSLGCVHGFVRRSLLHAGEALT